MTCILLFVWFIWFVLNFTILVDACASDGYDGYADPKPGMTLPEYRAWYWTRNRDYTLLANILILVALFPSLLISLALSGIKAVFSFLFIRKKS